MRRKLTLILMLAAILATGLAATGTSAQQAGKKKTFRKGEWLDPDRSDANGSKYKTFNSKSAGCEVSYLVYLPPDYDKETKNYPVIYWLHGLGGNQRGGAMMFTPHVDSAIRKGTLTPAIVVSVNGMVSSFYCDAVTGKLPMESVIVKDLVPHVDKTYRTVARPEGRLIQGYSMGGYGAGHLAFKYPDVFGSVVIDAGALIGEEVRNGPNLAGIFKDVFGEEKERFKAEHPFQLAEANAARIRNKMNIRIGCGKDDGLLPRNREMHDILTRLKIDHEYEVVPGVDHNGAKYYKILGAKGLELHQKAFKSINETK
jgi:endo-1,4-beta-xylanase